MLPLSSGQSIADSGGPALKLLPDQLVSKLHTRNEKPTCLEAMSCSTRISDIQLYSNTVYML